MRTRALCLALVALAAASHAEDKNGPSSEPGPRIVFAERDHIFPPTIQGEKVVHAFKFKNAGTTDLLIRKVETTCGCTVGKISRDRVPAGEEGSIELILDTSEKLGTATIVRATVFTNDTSQTMVGPCTTTIELKGEVVTCYRLLPTGAWFGEVIRNREPLVREVRVGGVLDAIEGFEITGIDVPQPWIKVEPRKLQGPELQGAKAGCSLKVTLLPNVPAGEFMQWVVVHTNIARQPHFRFPIVGMASGPIRGPERTEFDRVKRGLEVDRLCRLERIDGTLRGVRILGIETDESRFVASHEVVVEGLKCDVHLKLKKDAPPGPFATAVVVRLDDPETPRIRIVVFGDILPRVTCEPALLVLPAKKEGAEAAATVLVEGGKLLDAKIDRDDLKLERNDDHSQTREMRHSLKIVAKGALEPGLAKVTLRTDVAGEETVTVPVEIR